ncbi:MAG: MFS transporter [Firmicutes bacterium]|nr:MFS transporter [Bacillota bacterium]
MAVAAPRIRAPELRLWQRVLYSAAVVGANLTDTAIATWVMFFYAPPAGRGQLLAPITWVAGALVLGRVIDAATNPIVGFWSDRSRHPRGRRIPFLAYTALPMALLFTALWYPPAADPGATIGGLPVNGVYAALVLALFYFCYSSYFCPHGALLPEVTDSEEERIYISMMTAVAGLLGIALVGVASGVLVERYGFRVTGLVIGLASAASFLGPLVAIREKPRGEADEVPFAFREAVVLTLRNRPFVLFELSTIFALLAQNVLMLAMPYFITVVVGGTESQMGYLLGGSLLVSLLSFPMVARLAAEWGKARVYRFSLLLGAILLSALFLVGRFDLPISRLGQTVVLVALSGLGFAPSLALPPAILADTIDHDYHLTGKRRSAMYMGIQGIMQKSSLALAPAIVSALFRVYGYSPSDPTGVYLAGPVGGLLLLLGWFLFAGYPLEE